MALWDKITSRGNVDDRRASGGYIGGGLGVAGIAILLLFNYLNGGSVGDAFNQIQNLQIQPTQSYNASDFEGQDSYEVIVPLRSYSFVAQQILVVGEPTRV